MASALALVYDHVDVKSARRLLAARLRLRERDLCTAIQLRVRQVAPDADRDTDPDRVQSVQGTIAAAVGAWLDRVERPYAAVADLPSGAWETVRIAARHGPSLGA